MANTVVSDLHDAELAVGNNILVLLTNLFVWLVIAVLLVNVVNLNCFSDS